MSLEFLTQNFKPVRDEIVDKEWGVLAKARQNILSENLREEIRRRCEVTLDNLKISLSAFAEVDTIPVFPELHYSVMDDGSVTLEFIQTDVRLLFNIELSDEESSWCLITSSEKGAIQKVGRLFPFSMANVCWLLSYIRFDHAFSASELS